jgi:hypothetical protein
MPDGIVGRWLLTRLWPKSEGVGDWGPCEKSEENCYFQFWNRFVTNAYQQVLYYYYYLFAVKVFGNYLFQVSLSPLLPFIFLSINFK